MSFASCETKVINWLSKSTNEPPFCRSRQQYKNITFFASKNNGYSRFQLRFLRWKYNLLSYVGREEKHSELSKKFYDTWCKNIEKYKDNRMWNNYRQTQQFYSISGYCYWKYPSKLVRKLTLKISRANFHRSIFGDKFCDDTRFYNFYFPILWKKNKKKKKKVPSSAQDKFL